MTVSRERIIAKKNALLSTDCTYDSNVIVFGKMNEYNTTAMTDLRVKATRPTYSSESNDDFDKPMDDRSPLTAVDSSNTIMKTPQSLDDLLDVDDNNNKNEDERSENAANTDGDDDDDNSTHLSIDNPNAIETARQKKSIEKNGKI